MKKVWEIKPCPQIMPLFTIGTLFYWNMFTMAQALAVANMDSHRKFFEKTVGK